MIILDPRDTIVLDTITVIIWPHPSGDSCATRRYVMRLHRNGADPWQVLVNEEVDGKLVEPALGAFPGPKEAANGSFECEPGVLIVHYSGKTDPDPLAPYQEMEERIAIPGIYPIGLVAAWRVRNVASILVRHFPDLKEDLAPYLK